ncbi:hypothetical protein EV667_3680 [Ancylobacter aquaticus]|uniref:Uncharacterized protein n=2 Tax=Ancylobacter aquaticus TaxID=100 RepID=A0A4R1HMU9_ANCAQ|nr:hypothetical protein EV667_3680 [Ancylobacter aquaticus]
MPPGVSGEWKEIALRYIDFSSWHGLLVTLLGLALFALVGVGIRLLVMLTFQQRRERMNRQINERLRTLIAAYKVLGGSFTGDLTVDPRHLRDVRKQPAPEGSEGTDDVPATAVDEGSAIASGEGSDRRRRIRDAVEAALSDIILLGTEEHVRLAERAARELIAGRPVHLHDLVVALRNFIREALDLAPIPADLAIPNQGPTRPGSPGGRGNAERGANTRGGGGGGAGMAMGGGAGMGLGVGGASSDDASPRSTETR